MEIEAFFDPGTYTLSYVVYDAATGDAVILDPVLDYDAGASQTSTGSVDRLCAFVQGRGLRARYVLETHAHADHLSGSQLLRRRLGALVGIGERICEVQRTFQGLLGLPADFPTDGRQFDRLLADGEELHAGSVRVAVLATPGHTPACVSYRVGDAVFTGDALFLEDYGTGRCDFPQGSARDLYRSVHGRLYALPPETRVFVGHDYQPGGRPLRFATTVERQRRENIQLCAATEEEAFVRFRSQRDATLAAPRLLYPSVQVNINGGRLPPADAAGRRFLSVPL